MECPSGSGRFAVGEASHCVRSRSIRDCCAGEAACTPSIGSPSQAFSQELTSSAHPADTSVQKQEKPQGQLSHPQIPDPQNSEQNKMAVSSYCAWGLFAHSNNG